MRSGVNSWAGSLPTGWPLAVCPLQDPRPQLLAEGAHRPLSRFWCLLSPLPVTHSGTRPPRGSPYTLSPCLEVIPVSNLPQITQSTPLFPVRTPIHYLTSHIRCLGAVCPPSGPEDQRRWRLDTLRSIPTSGSGPAQSGSMCVK